MDIRIGVIQSPRELSLELADDVDRADLQARITAVMSGASDALWLTDRKGRDVAVAGSKIAYVELGTVDGARRIGFGG